jgi:hypothetical protein
VKKKLPQSSREFDINPELPLWEKLLLLDHYALGVPMSDILKNRGVPSRAHDLPLCHRVHMVYLCAMVFP